ncbi:MAG: methylenetetrahydrofolate--tRNA-(uracil(54)-C(5))-methyltransferase (FADH(2)-oxidizing) TrmFO [Clostridia bacterium]|nr:methylenetetrahydrofolate--tRNA-(uracil(54)-C(5))-methyltransferase (FADH(2)-oxidizing) TrmFO [Clostridia bacterium]
MKTKPAKVNIIGAGLAGCEAAYQLSKRGVAVVLYEMKPEKMSPAHHEASFAEIVCSNSMKSEDMGTASGALKAELDILDCLTLRIARETRVAAGSALAVDRKLFSARMTEEIKKLANVEIVSREVTHIDTEVPTIIATGPLTSDGLSQEIASLLGDKSLYFFDASAPIVEASSIDMSKAFTSGRYGKGESDYINCPMDRDEYYAFVRELKSAERVPLKDFENTAVFEGCMPVEVMASRGDDTLRFGPLRPVGLVDANGKRPFAVVQLRRENTESELWGIVGFQTNLTFGEQKRVFSMIPALSNAEFVKYGVMHRNTYINSPKHLNADFSMKAHPFVFFAGQIAGVEGYVESIASGLLCGINMARKLEGKPSFVPDTTTIVGGLMHHISSATENFQPMNANFGILQPLDEIIRDKSQKKLAYSKRAVDNITKQKGEQLNQDV